MIVKSAVIDLCDDCAPKVQVGTRRLLNQIARLLEERHGDKEAADALRKVADTFVMVAQDG